MIVSHGRPVKGAGFRAGARNWTSIALLALGAMACAGLAGCARGVSGQVSAHTKRPDLVVELSVSDTVLSAGAKVILPVTVRNAGKGTSPATTLRYYQSADATITTQDTEVGTGAVGALASSGSSDGSRWS